jgi:hypothetical protein
MCAKNVSRDELTNVTPDLSISEVLEIFSRRHASTSNRAKSCKDDEGDKGETSHRAFHVGDAQRGAKGLRAFAQSRLSVGLEFCLNLANQNMRKD